jgi:AcrR family transcriptional regulator
MTSDWPLRRETFRHGNLPEAILQAALERLKTEDAASLNVRQLARDVGVDHRALYRHFPDKLSLLAAVAEHGWRQLGQDMNVVAKGKEAGEESLVACGVGFITFARENSNLFHLMAGARLNVSGSFPGLERAVADALALLLVGFEVLIKGHSIARSRAALFASALQGVSTQILYGRLRISTKSAPQEMANISRMLVKGLR